MLLIKKLWQCYMKYNRYPVYRDTEVEWLGEIPEEWRSIRYKYILFEKKKKSNHSLNCGSISFGKVITKDNDKIPEETRAAYQEVLAGEFLVNPLNLNFDLISLRTALSTIDVVVSTGYIVLNSDLAINKNYLRWLLHQFDVAHMKTLGSGVRQTINYTDIGNSYFYLPSDQEQEDIGNYLDNATNKIDTLISKQEKLVELLKEKRQAVISHAVTQGLDPTVSLKNSGVEWLGVIPEHWNIIKIKYLIKNIESGTSVNSSDQPATNNDYGVLKTSCVYSGEFNYEENKTVVENEKARVSCPLKTNTLVVSRMNTPELVGAAGSVKYAPINIYLPDRLWQISFTNSSTYFIHYLTLTNSYRSYIQTVCSGTSSTMQNLSQDDFKNFIVPMPDIEEQQFIANCLDISMEKIGNLIIKSNKLIELLKEKRAALISAVVTGKIDVSTELNTSVREA